MEPINCELDGSVHSFTRISPHKDQPLLPTASFGLPHNTQELRRARLPLPIFTRECWLALSALDVNSRGAISALPDAASLRSFNRLTKPLQVQVGSKRSRFYAIDLSMPGVHVVCLIRSPP